MTIDRRLLVLGCLLAGSAFAGEAPASMPVMGLKKGTTFTLLKAAPLARLDGQVANAGSFFVLGVGAGKTVIDTWFKDAKDGTTAFLGTKNVKFQTRQSGKDVTFETPTSCFMRGQEIGENDPTPVLPKDRILDLESIEQGPIDLKTTDEGTIGGTKVTIKLKDPKGFVSEIVCVMRRRSKDFESFFPLTVGQLNEVFSDLFSVDVLDQEVNVPEGKSNDILEPDTKGHLI